MKNDIISLKRTTLAFGLTITTLASASSGSLLHAAEPSGIVGNRTARSLIGGLVRRTAHEQFALRGSVTAIAPGGRFVTARLFQARQGRDPVFMGETVQLKVAPQHASSFRVGQHVRANAPRTQVALTPFPIQGSRRDDLGHSHKMETSFIFSKNGRIDAKTRTWSGEALRGFTGAVVIAITDQDGNVLFTTQPKSYGVNGESVPGARSDRTELWNQVVPEDVVNAAGGYAIYHVHNPTDRLLITLGQATEVAREVKDLIVEVKGIIAEVHTTSAGE